MFSLLTFSHPDCTVGFGFAPNQFYGLSSIGNELAGLTHRHLAGYGLTAGREFHPAPKVFFVQYDTSFSPSARGGQVLPRVSQKSFLVACGDSHKGKKLFLQGHPDPAGTLRPLHPRWLPTFEKP